LSGPRVERKEELAMCLRYVFILENGNTPKIPHGAKNLLLEDRSLKMAHDFQILHAIDVAQVTCGFIVLEWVKDLKFHCLTEVVDLEKSPLEGADHTGPAERNQQFFNRIEIDHAIG
jgi:hypothetical protein